MLSQETGLIVFFVGAALFIVSMCMELGSHGIRDDEKERLRSTVKTGVALRVLGILLVVVGALVMTPK